MKNNKTFLQILIMISFTLLVGMTIHAEEDTNEKDGNNVQLHTQFSTELTEKVLPDPVPRFVYQSEFNFEYPDAVRGVYVTGHSAGGERFNDLKDLIASTALNTMVIDIKDDHGNITYKVEDDSKEYSQFSQNFIKDPQAMLKELEEEKIYPIARIVVFKDTNLAEMKPEWSFKENGSVWKNGRGEAFVNPFIKDVWKYNLEIAKEAAKMGFQEIQFDYVRFPEGFEKRDESLDYSRGDFDKADLDNIKERVNAVTSFVEYANKELEPYDVDVSVDIFGYTATIEEAPGIGQNFLQIADNVDVISSMIYPSHWTSYFGIEKPDTEPYKLVDEYSKSENELLDQLEDRPISRPWIQDFTASWLYPAGQAFTYGKKEVEAQIRALYDNDIYEYLIWNSGNRYTEGVNFDPK
ncbi:putative glycoside hydrolase [Allobacillus sp. GCM10007491]|uniref:Glycoside hydrolase n=1 Tax=Allobacillus saliphilus TaxID=2912308 RepID=A0A941CV63_9BACI|nr:putative glycoside hydrolase [Allobacillus saliphilus]MBR7554552.1 putative glycoside hydrolase [Allobacillus saliphilus]